MRKVTECVVKAFLNRTPKAVGNTHTDGQSLYLHGNKIAYHNGEGIYATLAGWPTVTTRDRLNGVCNLTNSPYRFSQRNHSQYFGEEEISASDTILITPKIL